jgi:hypothetical protein
MCIKIPETPSEKTKVPFSSSHPPAPRHSTVLPRRSYLNISNSFLRTLIITLGNSHTMAMTRHDRVGLPPHLMASNILVWISAVIVMGILSYFISLNNNQGSHIIYEEVIVSDTHSSHS